eukprot:COSAG05_NODE_116_length_17986_cov_348.987534_18_plen_143_part_00
MGKGGRALLQIPERWHIRRRLHQLAQTINLETINGHHSEPLLSILHIIVLHESHGAESKASALLRAHQPSAQMAHDEAADQDYHYEEKSYAAAVKRLSRFTVEFQEALDCLYPLMTDMERDHEITAGLGLGGTIVPPSEDEF